MLGLTLPAVARLADGPVLGDHGLRGSDSTAVGAPVSAPVVSCVAGMAHGTALGCSRRGSRELSAFYALMSRPVLCHIAGAADRAVIWNARINYSDSPAVNAPILGPVFRRIAGPADGAMIWNNRRCRSHASAVDTLVSRYVPLVVATFTHSAAIPDNSVRPSGFVAFDAFPGTLVVFHPAAVAHRSYGRDPTIHPCHLATAAARLAPTVLLLVAGITDWSFSGEKCVRAGLRSAK